MTNTTTLSVKGMTCSNCSGSITSQLQSTPGVQKAEVSLITEEATVKHDDSLTPDIIKEAIEDCGFDAEVLSSIKDIINNIYLSKFKVVGMTCSNCTNSIRDHVEPHVKKFDISAITEEADVEHDINELTTDQILDMIDDCGFDAVLVESHPIDSHVDEDTLQTVVSVKGMTCGACSASIHNALIENENVENCEVSLLTEQAIVKHTSKLKPEDIKEAIEDCGFDAEIVESSKFVSTKVKRDPATETTRFTIYKDNIDSLLSQVTDIPGVISSSHTQSVLSVTYDSEVVGVRALVREFKQIGFKAEPQSLIDQTNQQLTALQKKDEIYFWRKNFVKTAIVGFPMFAIDHLYPIFTGEMVNYHLIHGLYMNTLLELVVASYIQFTVGVFFFRNAMKAWKHGSGTMDTLIFVSTNISYYFSILTIIVSFFKNNGIPPHTLFETAVLLMNFVSLGKWMESKAKSETSTSLSQLLSLTSTECSIIEHPENFTVEQPGSTRTIKINYLQINDIVSVKPGAKLPADGIIIHGESEIDESLLTGESLPIHKKVNDTVYGGSINGPGHLFVQIKTTSENSQLSKIIKLVKLAQLQKAPIQSYADYIASIFVPTILILGLITFICWIVLCYALPNPPAIFLTKDGKLFVCLNIAITVIVIACPCALGLASPTAIMVGTGVGAKHGVLIKGGSVLEVCDNIDVLLFDKTGTLTLGEMSVSAEHLLNNKFPRDLILQTIGNLESKSEHPIGIAIVDHVVKETGKSFETLSAIEFEVLMGKGLVGSFDIDDEKYVVQIGNLKLFNEEFLASDAIFSNLKIDSDFTLAHIAINGEYVGYLELKDIPKPDSKNVISYLRSQGYEVAMVTGDSLRSATKIANEVGIPQNNIFAEVSPYGKEQLVAEFQEKKNLRVAFVGDGLNDSPALAKADLGIAIASGTDIAIDAADIVIMNPSQSRGSNSKQRATLQNVLNAIDISQLTLSRIKWNFFWSSVYNVTMVPIAMGVLIPWGIQLSPMSAGLSMAFSSVSVVMSSLWLKSWKPRDLTDYDLDVLDDYDLEAGERINVPKKNRNKWSFKRSFKALISMGNRRSSNNHNVGPEDIELQTGLLSSSH